jgi:mannose-6-phosphate isomerase class I
MLDLYPLLLRPQFHERIWGARSLAPIYPDLATSSPIGEAWLTGEECRVANGPLSGRALGELSREFGERLTGEAAALASRFPLLIKFLFPRDKLSVQVDMVYVDAGTVHAIGPGAVIVETQQNSDTTFRLYDYGRPRELHLEQGLRATRERTRAGKGIAGQAVSQNGRTQLNLISSPCFIVDKFILKETWQFKRPQHARKSVWCLVATRGCGVVDYEGGAPVTIAAGEAIVVPAAVDRFILRPQWELEFLCSSLPIEEVQHPKTVLFEATASST